MGNKARVKCKVKEKGKAMGRDKGKANAKGKVGAKAVEDARLPSAYPTTLKRGDISKRLARLDGNRRRRAHHFRGSGLDAPFRVVGVDFRDQHNRLPIGSALENVYGDFVATTLPFALVQINGHLHTASSTIRIGTH
jgi:hypothetical protein